VGEDKLRPYKKHCPVGVNPVSPLQREDANTFFGAWVFDVEVVL
jgi:hypothetical protein